MGNTLNTNVRLAAIKAALSAVVSCMLVVMAVAEPVADFPKQVPLTEQSIQNVIAAQADLEVFAKTLQSPGEELTTEQEAEVNEIAVKHGFATFNDLEDATTTISMVLASIDPETGEFSEPRKVLEEELEAIKADKDLVDEDRAIMIAEIEATIATDPKVDHPENIALVQKFKDQLIKVLQ
ncbi:MAG: hypothetical protein AAFV45_07195 [Pseudomonadota bacterium]